MSERSLEDWIAEFIERREAGELLDVDEFASLHPTQSRRLRKSLLRFQDTESMFPESPPLSPRSIGRFEVLGEIGRGGMGHVLRARDRTDPSGVRAIKLLNPTAVMSSRARARFQRECELLRTFRHPGVARVFESGEVDGTPYLVMELVEGPSLSECVQAAKAAKQGVHQPALPLVLNRDQESYQSVARVVLELADAVASLHEHGVLHRDLKPSNVIINEQGRPILVDFGLIGKISSSSLTKSGDLVGTVPYMSPEQARGERGDERTDVYGLGAVLYEMLTFEPPYPGEDAISILPEVQQGRIHSPRQHVRTVPRALDVLAQRCLAPNRSSRLSGVRELKHELDRFLRGEPIQTGSFGIREYVLVCLRRHKQSIAVAASILVLLSALGFWWWTSRREHRLEQWQIKEREAARAWLDHDLDALRRIGLSMSDMVRGDPWGRFLAGIAADDPSYQPSEEPFRTLFNGVNQYNQEHYERAAGIFDEVADQRPGELLPLAFLAAAVQHLQDDDKVVRELDAATRLIPDSAVLLTWLGERQVEVDEYRDAVKVLSRAVALDPTNANAYQALSDAWFALEEPERALEFAEQAVENAPESAKDGFLISYCHKLEQAEKPEQALQMAAELARRRPDYSMLHLSMGRSYDRLHRFWDAEKAYLSGLDNPPYSNNLLLCLAFLYAGSDRQNCEQCQEFFAANPEMYRPKQSEEYLLQLVERDRGKTPGMTEYVARIAVRIGRTERLLELLEGIASAAGEVDEAVVRLERAIRLLR